MTRETGANAELAGRARELAAAAGIQRRAWLCCAVALAETSTTAAARKVLADTCPDPVRPAALAALDSLTGRTTP